MTINSHATKIEQELNVTLKKFQFGFKTLADKSILQIEDFPEIYFPNIAGGGVAGGSFSWVNQKHKNGGIHEPATVAALLTMRNYQTHPNPVFFDIGSLFGYFSLIVQSLFSHATVRAFEMNPHSFSMLERNIAYNKHLGTNIECLNLGLSYRTLLNHKTKIAAFRIEEENTKGEGVHLDIMALDDFCREKNIKPTLMKIDVEGYQAKIIPGAMNTIAKNKPIILLEFDNGKFMMENFGCTNKSVIKPLFNLGYSLFWCAEQRGRLSQFEQISFDDLKSRHEKNSLAVFIPL